MKTLDPAERAAFDEPGDALARPHANCYWLLPGRILAGEYPRNVDDASSRLKLRAILSAGVSRFVDLTEPHELEPYADLMQSEAARQGVTATHARHPVRDLWVPKAGAMRAILEAIAAHDAGVTYVHCWGGVGRTGTVAGCLLVEAGFTGEEAIAILSRKWMVMEKRRRHPRTPETLEQVQFIRMWEGCGVA
jgi:protein-tyrosine phosphatase